MKILLNLQISILINLCPIYINGEQAICSTEPLLEFSEDCDAKDSISNYKIQSSQKRVNRSLNGQAQILFDKCSISDSLKFKRCIRISSEYRKY